MSAAETTEVQLVNLTIDGQEVQARPGQTILEAAQAAGIEIPTLCHDPRLEPYGACRMCLVEVEGARGPMASCGTAVREGMKVQTRSEKIIKIRKFVLALLLTNHPLDCPVCEAAGDCRLQDYAYEYLVDMVPWGWRGPVVGDPGTHPNIAHFGERCILCGRCVRICREVMSIGCWGYLNRGYESEVDTPYRLPLQEVGCVSCGQCVSTCPVGAIVGQRTPQGAREWQTEKTVTTCSYCADGCRLVLHSYRGKVVRVASEVEKGVNRGNLCVKGRFGIGYADAPDRITKPLVRNAVGEMAEASWDEALALVRARLAAARAEKGGSGIAAICGTHCTNEAAYLAQKLMRTVLSSNNIDSIDHGEQAASEEALKGALGVAATTNSRKDLCAAEVILVVGANLTECDPVLALDVIKAMRTGKTVIVIDPRTTELAEKAQYHLAVKPGTDPAALRGMLRHILDEGLQNADFIATQTEGFSEVEISLANVDVAAEAAICGVDADVLKAAAGAFGRAGAAAIMYGSGVAQGSNAVDTIAAIVDLALLTGNLGRPGTGLYPLKSGANSQGLVDMGVRPSTLPGGVPLDDEEGLARLEACWGSAPTGNPAGLSAGEMVEALEKDKIDVLYVIGADPALALADEARVRAALNKTGFLIVQESFPSDTAEYADVILPAAVACEDEGTFTNTERFVQRVRPAVSPQGESRPDWEIVQSLANALGAGWSYASPSDVMEEISAVVPDYAGVSFADLEDEGRQWPLADSDVCRESILHSDRSDGKVAFQPVATGGAPSAVDADFAFTLLTGCVREHHATGVRTRRSPGSTNLVAEARLQLNPADADRLGVAAGDKVRVAARGGATLETSVEITTRVPEGVVFLPGFDPAAPVTRLLAGRELGAPAVKVEKVA